MARLAITQRPPIFTSLCLAAVAIVMQPAATPGAVEPTALGPRPKCVVAGEWHGDLYVPQGHWTMPTTVPHGHWTMPIVPGPAGTGDVIDVDRLVSALKHVLSTPHT